MSEDSATSQQLDAAIEKLVQTFHPDAIYLFGSLLKGKQRPESSVDLLIIAPDVASIRFLDRIKRAIKATEDVLSVVTPLVYTPEEVKLLQNQGDGFMTEVLEEAKILYQKSSS